MSTHAIAPTRKAPLPGTPVLLSRPLRPEIDPETLSRFGEDRWDLTPGIFEDHSDSTTINFQRIPQPWRNAVKEYLWQLINEEAPRALASARAGVRCSLRSVSFVKGPIERLIIWARARGLQSFIEMDAARLDEYLAHLADTGVSYGSRQHSVAEVRRLWAYRDVVPHRLAMPQAPPWDDAPARELLGGRSKEQPHNRTPRISDATLVPLLTWAIRFVEEISSDILPNFDEYSRILKGGARYRPVGQRLYETRRREKLAHVMGQHRAAGLGLPGRVLPDGSHEVRWAHLGRLTGTLGSTHAKYDRPFIEASGIRIDHDAYLTPGCTATIDGIPWHKGPMKYDDALGYARLLLTACYVVTAYLSGMRPGEILNLTAGCLLHDPERNQWTVRGTRWKGATGTDGGKAEEGAPRANPWVVHPLVAQAITVAEKLGDGRLLFPRSIRPKETRPSTRKIIRSRPGQALTATQMALDIASFMEWVNDFCHRHNYPGTIPNDPDGRITPSRFRRTLAWHIVRRPRGLVAAAIQYGHINVHVTQGYAGNYASGFPDEIAFEQWLERIDQAVDLEAYLDAGGHVSGPAAAELARRVHATGEKFSGKVLLTGRQARKLLEDPVLQVHPGRGLHCVFDLAKARCITATAEGPDLSECQPSCANIARTGQDIDELRARLERLPDDSLAPSIRHQRTTTIRESIQGIIDTHGEGTL
ncbi:hypothetical protein QEH68_22165 (plasmid) [Paenarthrobacter sp. OM7]|uniref:hypothetical protein n=1 Tax=Paenarthrobacter sp. OM7 TaxID=3041264 RepID=UPI0024697183|nr:hypothetical protein [Paenarthrobacter sp. OM7]WGM22836.1 hypothetical protein QEH68_22165 [Paenarthrobacter sp. OM7]